MAPPAFVSAPVQSGAPASSRAADNAGGNMIAKGIIHVGQTIRHAVAEMAIVTVILTVTLALSTAQAADLSQTVDFNIPPQLLPSALLKYSEQSGVQVTSPAELVDGKSSVGVVGSFSARTALTRLLQGTDLEYKVINANTVTILQAIPGTGPRAHSGTNGGDASVGGVAEPNTAALAEREPDSQMSRSSSMQDERAGAHSTPLRETADGIPEVLVEGSRILNMDIRRSEDDAQPYVIFDRDVIENSGAVSIEDFLKQRLTANAVGSTFSQSGSLAGAASQVNLRGLGVAQTLILIDGHRVAGWATGGNPQQPDLNGIPLSAVERIEVLPSTASAIYGGGATGGVINVILRRDYTGAEVKLNYENTFDSDVASRRLDLSSGLALEDGKTSVLFAGSLVDANSLTIGDRDLVQRGRERIAANNPGYFSSLSFFLGATPNIRSANGTPLFGPGTPTITSVPVGYAGGGGLAPLQSRAGSYNQELAPTRQPSGAGMGLLNAPTLASGILTVRRQFTPHVEAFVELDASNNESRFPSSDSNSGLTIAASAPNNPFGQTIQVTIPTRATDGEVVSEHRNRRLVAGVLIGLPKGWQAVADYTWNPTELSFTLNQGLSSAGVAAIRNGTIDVLRDLTAFPVDLSPYVVSLGSNLPYRTTLRDATLRLAGPLGSLPAGAPAFTMLLEHREEDLAEGFLTGTSNLFFPSRSQAIDSAYLEMRLPIISGRNAMPWLKELELQLAVRHDEYTVNGVTGSINLTTAPNAPVNRARNETRSTDPMLSLRWKPVEDLALRASYGTGFLPPTVNQLVPNPTPTTGGNRIDPRRGNTLTGSFLQFAGGDPNLGPEESESWSAGAILMPRALPGLRMSLDYTSIRKTDNIANLDAQQVIDNEALLPGRVTRGPVAPGDPFDVGPITAVDLRRVNIAKALVTAFDFAVDYQLSTDAFGTFDFYVLATRQIHYETQLVPTAPVIENVGLTSNNPLKLKANAGFVWQHRRWKLGWSARYFDSYLVDNPASAAGAITVLNQGGREVASQTYHDVFAAYSTGSQGGDGGGILGLSNSEIRLGVKNVLNEEPPFDAFDTSTFYSRYGDARLATYFVSIRKGW